MFINQNRTHYNGLGTVAYTCNPSTLGDWVGWIRRSGVWDQPDQRGEIPSLLKIQKVASVVASACNPATQEAEVGESLEPRRQGLQWAKIVPLHSKLGDVSKNKTKQTPKWDNSVSWSTPDMGCILLSKILVSFLPFFNRRVTWICIVILEDSIIHA